MTEDQPTSAQQQMHQRQPSLGQQSPVPNSPAAESIASAATSRTSTSTTPTSDQGDQLPPPPPASRRSSSSHAPPPDLLQPTLLNPPPKPDQPETGVVPPSTSNSLHHQQHNKRMMHQNNLSLSRSNSYEEEITQEFEAYRQEYLLAHGSSNHPKRNNNNNARSLFARCYSSRICQVIFIAVALQVLTLIIFLVVFRQHYSTTNNNVPTSSGGGGTPLGEYHSGTYLMPPPKNISSVCTLEKVQESQKGLEDCLALCQPSSCCHLSHMEPKSCWTDNVDACHAYEAPCDVLNNHGNNGVPSTAVVINGNDAIQVSVYPNAVGLWNDVDLLTQAPDFLWETCQAAFVLSSEWQVSETSMATLTCQETCDKARCCWDTSLTSPADRCWTHPHCDHFVEACNVLADPREVIPDDASFSGGFKLSVPPAPDRLAAFCHPANIEKSLEELLACHEACLAAECCWNDALLETQRCTYDEQCPNYVETCSVLMDPFYPPSFPLSELQQQQVDNNEGDETDSNVASDTTTITADDVLEDYPPKVIWDVCYNHDNNIPLPDGSGATLCEKLCAPGSCCFDPAFSGCPTSYAEDYCDRFRPCQVLVDDQHSPETYIEEACTNLNDLSDCLNLCATSTCCFTSDALQTCAETHPDIRCSHYEACEVLYTGSLAASSTETDTDGNGEQ